MAPELFRHTSEQIREAWGHPRPRPRRWLRQLGTLRVNSECARL